MYSQSYNDNASHLSIPPGYSGTAISECDDTPSDTGDAASKTSVGASGDMGVFSRILPFMRSKLPFSRSGLFEGFTLGREEILIIATAAFLFFSEDGDRECAILLLILLFIF